MRVLQIAGCALLGAVLVLLVRELRPSLSIPVRLATTLLLVAAALALCAPALTGIGALLQLTDTGEQFAPVLRALGIAVICELCALFCRDLGENGIAEGVQLFGKLEILLLSLPLLDQLLEIAKELLEL